MKDTLFSPVGGLSGIPMTGFHRGGLVSLLQKRGQSYRPTIHRMKISADTATMLDDLERNRPTMSGWKTIPAITIVVTAKVGEFVKTMDEAAEKLRSLDASERLIRDAIAKGKMRIR